MGNRFESVFIGTDIEANYIATMLQDEDIPCFVRNNFQASLTIGWVDGNADQSTELLVNAEDFEKAKKIVDSYQNNKE